MKRRPPGHIPELQSLRGMAAVAVMIGHSLNYYDTPQWFRSFSLIFNGRAAVVVFFVLSGYVLTRSLRNASFDRATVLRFYVQRIFRIYPAIWAASAIGLFYLFALHWRIPVAEISDGVRHQFRLDRFDALHIAASFAGMLAFILPQLWSIFVEIVASAVMPVIAYVVLRRPRWSPGMLAVAVLASYLIGHYTYYYVGLYFMDFIAGAMLAMPGGLLGRLCNKIPARGSIAMGLLALALTQYLPLDYYDPTAHIVETGLASLVIALLIYAKERVRSLSSQFLVFVGDISYSVYLLHYVVLCMLAKLIAVITLVTSAHFYAIPISILIASATCILTLPLAWLSYECVEKPGVRLGKLVLVRWLVKPSSASLTSPSSDVPALSLRR